MQDVIWNKRIETASRDDLHDIQTGRLKSMVEHVYKNVPFYRVKMQETGIEPEDIRDAADIRYLPFTDKKDLRDNYPFGLFAMPKSEIIRIHASSGTTGKPTVTGYTAKDIQIWAELMARSLSCAGVTRDSVVHVAYGYGLFTGGLGVHYGVEKIGASVVPVSGGNTARQLLLLEDLGATTICCTPSYALNLAEAMSTAGIGRERIKLESGVFGAEPWSDNMRSHLEEKLGICAMDIYGLTEMMGPGVAMECAFKQGLHVWEDAFLPEILDNRCEPLPLGHDGELVFTTLNKQGMPLLRYRTHDISALDDTVCPCGRTHIRMRRVKARTDDMLIIRGVNVFPSQIEQALLQIPGITPNYMVIVDTRDYLDTLSVHVELDQYLIGDTVRDLECLRDRIEEKLASDLLVHADVRLCQPGSLPRSEGKAKRVTDNRKQ
jgi:phenylacetate-CoA ligase